MIHFKHHNASSGFMLMEVLLALAIVGIVLTSIFGLQSTIINRVATVSGKIQRLFVAENFLVDARQKFLTQESGHEKQEKIITDPAATVRYQVKKIPQKGYFKKTPGMMQEETEVIWKKGASTRSEFIVTLLYRPENRSKQQQKT